MSFDQVRETVEGVFSASWSSTPVSYDNVPFDSTKQSRWIRVIINDGDSFKGGLGPECTLVKHAGEVAVQIFTGQWIGSKVARDYADAVSALFSNTVQDDISFSQARVVRLGHTEDVYQINVYIPYIYQER